MPFLFNRSDPIIYNTEKNVAPLLNSPIGATLRVEQRKNNGKVWTHSRTESGPTLCFSALDPVPTSFSEALASPNPFVWGWLVLES